MKTAAEADNIPIVLSKTGAVPDLGHSSRIADKNQTLALYARDIGCSFPGCDTPPEWCERHHVTERYRNGQTNLANLTLLCTYHHHLFQPGRQLRQTSTEFNVRIYEFDRRLRKAQAN